MMPIAGQEQQRGDPGARAIMVENGQGKPGGGPGACGGFCRQQESFDFLSEYKTVSEFFLFHQFLLSG